LNIYCDSSTRVACIVIEGQEPELFPYPAPVTNNEGEYKALLVALTRANELNLCSPTILSDSQLVVNQVWSDWKCNSYKLKGLRDFAISLVAKTKAQGCWIPREENLAGRVIDGK